MIKKLLLSFVLCSAMITHVAHARDQVRIVGSSTVFPFVAAAAERFSEQSGSKAPIVESIGTGAGMIEFCKGIGVDTPDIVNASRQMTNSESAICERNNVGDVVEIPIGMDGIVLASSNEASRLNLSRETIFLALAKEVPIDGKLVANPYNTWSDIDPALPAYPIEVYGPKTTSGTRDAFVELVMEPSCVENSVFAAQYADEKTRKKACHMIREDGAYIEAGENDNLIIQKLTLNNNAMGIFGFGYLDQNMDKVIAHQIEGRDATFENIADGSYPVARSMFVYAKKAHIAAINALKPFLVELTSDNAISEDGYLLDRGLIPLEAGKLATVQSKVSAL